MADTLDTIQKLIALAMDNPSAEESRSAALKAVALIVEHNITLEGRGARTFDTVNTKKTYRPDQEFDAFWSKMGKDQEAAEGEDPDLGRAGGLATTQVDTDLDDDFMRVRIKKAWRALQRERARLKTEIENEYCTRFQKPYPRPNPIDWEKP